ncbi:MAG: CCA tRNA nucleotidyltransferase [Magnetospiraceae bacterium]
MTVGAPPATPTGKLPPQDWMLRPSCRAVVGALTANGAPVRFVGGCVRDAVLKRPIKDVDLATPAHPDKVAALLEACGIKVVPTGLKHGTVTAVCDGDPYEITTLRVDVETDGRHATVAFTEDWIADAARRDFTINALSCSPDGDIYDPFGGLDDLAHGRVRFVGQAVDRIAEDALRILRFFRFQAFYGRPPADRIALDACRLRAADLATLSGERIRQEMLRLLEAETAADVVATMRGLTVLDPILPEIGGVGPLRLLIWLETRAIRETGVSVDPLRRLAILLRDGHGGGAQVAGRLRMSRAETKRLAALVGMAPPIGANLRENDLRGLLYRHGAARVRDWVLLSWAEYAAVQARVPPKMTAGWTEMLEATQAWAPVTFPLRGKDIQQAGIPDGPRIGELYQMLEDWWVAGGCRADRQACLTRLRDYI